MFCFAIGSILYMVPKKLVVPVINQKEEKEDRTAEPDVFYRIVNYSKGSKHSPSEDRT